MRLILYCTYVAANEIVEVSVEAERLGFDGISFPDHVVFPLDHRSEYPYTKDGSTPWDEWMDFPDPFAVMGAVAAATQRLQLLTGILVLPLRHPLLTAKATATIDVLSGGRLALGIGVGWLREEFEALGVNYRRRGRMTDEAVELLRRLWSGQPTAHEGENYSFPALTVQPAATGKIPIYVGGTSEAALRRAARLGDGFIPTVGTSDETRAMLERVAHLRHEYGREDVPFEVVASAASVDKAEELNKLEEIGITSVRVDPFAPYHQRYGDLTMSQRMEALERYAAEVIRPLRSPPDGPPSNPSPLD